MVQVFHNKQEETEDYTVSRTYDQEEKPAILKIYNIFLI
jgi:hypothetical protein